MEKDERFKQAEFGAIVGIVGNIMLAIVKAVIGYIGNSKALLADAVHSGSCNWLVSCTFWITSGKATA